MNKLDCEGCAWDNSAAEQKESIFVLLLLVVHVNIWKHTA